MRVCLLLALLTFSVACSVAAGTQGDAGENAPGLVWKDGTGAQVTGGEELLLVDARGYQWVMNQETARPFVGAFDLYFDQAECTGNAYGVTFLPRRVFRVAGEMALRARPDTLESVEVAVASRRSSDGSCREHALFQRLLPITEATLPDPPLVEPSLSFAPPLHLEPR